MAAVGSMMAAALVGFLAVALWIYTVPPKGPGDRIAEVAKEIFVGRVSAVTDEGYSIYLVVETEQGPRSVELAEVGLVPALNPSLVAWRAKSLGVIRAELMGKEVAVYAARPRNPWGPSLAHVARYPNDWLNGDLVERGLCYTVRLDRSEQVAYSDLFDLEHAARDHRRGCWDFVSRDVFINFIRHI